MAGDRGKSAVTLRCNGGSRCGRCDPDVFGNDDKFIEALKLQCLDEAFDLGSQVG